MVDFILKRPTYLSNFSMSGYSQSPKKAERLVKALRIRQQNVRHNYPIPCVRSRQGSLYVILYASDLWQPLFVHICASLLLTNSRSLDYQKFDILCQNNPISPHNFYAVVRRERNIVGPKGIFYILHLLKKLNSRRSNGNTSEKRIKMIGICQTNITSGLLLEMNFRLWCFLMLFEIPTLKSMIDDILLLAIRLKLTIFHQTKVAHPINIWMGRFLVIVIYNSTKSSSDCDLWIGFLLQPFQDFAS